MQHVEITDRFGRKRRARKGEVLADGETIHFPVTLMDEMTRVMSDAMESDRMIRDAHGTPAGHRPGFAFASDGARLRDAANDAYEERRQRLQDAWRQRPQECDHTARALGAEHPQAQADHAWEDKKERLAQAWRHR